MLSFLIFGAGALTAEPAILLFFTTPAKAWNDKTAYLATSNRKPTLYVKRLRRFRPATDLRFDAYAPDRSDSCRTD